MRNARARGPETSGAVNQRLPPVNQSFVPRLVHPPPAQPHIPFSAIFPHSRASFLRGRRRPGGRRDAEKSEAELLSRDRAARAIFPAVRPRLDGPRRTRGDSVFSLRVSRDKCVRQRFLLFPGNPAIGGFLRRGGMSGRENVECSCTLKEFW